MRNRSANSQGTECGIVFRSLGEQRVATGYSSALAGDNYRGFQMLSPVDGSVTSWAKAATRPSARSHGSPKPVWRSLICPGVPQLAPLDIVTSTRPAQDRNEAA